MREWYFNSAYFFAFIIVEIEVEVFGFKEAATRRCPAKKVFCFTS